MNVNGVALLLKHTRKSKLLLNHFVRLQNSGITETEITLLK